MRRRTPPGPPPRAAHPRRSVAEVEREDDDDTVSVEIPRVMPAPDGRLFLSVAIGIMLCAAAFGWLCAECLTGLGSGSQTLLMRDDQLGVDDVTR